MSGFHVGRWGRYAFFLFVFTFLTLPVSPSSAKVSSSYRIETNLLRQIQNDGVSPAVKTQDTQNNEVIDVYITLHADFPVMDAVAVEAFIEKVHALGVKIVRIHWRSRTLFAEASVKQIYQVSEWDEVRLVSLPGRLHGNSIGKSPSFVKLQQAMCTETAGVEIIQSTEVIGLNNLITETGCGIKIGVICPGVADWDVVQFDNEIPLAFDVVTHASGTDILNDHEGTAMMEIIHDIAPDAELFAAVPQSDSELIALLGWLKSKGVDLIISDIAVFLPAMHPDGVFPYEGGSEVSQAIADLVITDQIPFIQSVNNSATGHYAATFDPDSNNIHIVSASSNILPVTVAAGSEISIELTWKDKFGQSTNDYAFHVVTGATDYLYVHPTVYGGLYASYDNIQNATAPGDPYEYNSVYIQNTGAVDLAAQIVITKATGADNKEFELFIRGSEGYGDFTFDLNQPSGSTRMPEDATAELGFITVGAADWNDSIGTHNWPQFIREYSARGPANDGKRKPDIIAPDGVQTAVGYIEAAYRDFEGASAAAPHVAGVVALMIEAATGISPAEIEYTLTDTARFMDASYGTYPNNSVGYGFINAEDAISDAVLNIGTLGQQTITIGSVRVAGTFISSGSSHTAQGPVVINGVVEVDGTDASDPIVVDESAQTVNGKGRISIPAIASIGTTSFYSGSFTLDGTGFLSSFDTSQISGLIGMDLQFNGFELTQVDPDLSGVLQDGVKISSATIAFGNLSLDVSSLTVNANGVLIESASFSSAGMDFSLTNGAFGENRVEVGSFSGSFGASGTIEFEGLVIHTGGTGMSFDSGLISALGFTITLDGGQVADDGSITCNGASIDGAVDFDIPAFSIANGEISILEDVSFEIAQLSATFLGGFTFGGSSGFSFHDGLHVEIFSGVELLAEGLDFQPGSFMASAGTLDLSGAGLGSFDFVDLDIDQNGINCDSFTLNLDSGITSSSGVDSGWTMSDFSVRRVGSETTVTMSPDPFSIGELDFNFTGVTLTSDPSLEIEFASFDSGSFSISLEELMLGGGNFDISGGSIEVDNLGSFALTGLDFDSGMISADQAMFTLLQGGDSVFSIDFEDLLIDASSGSLNRLAFTRGELLIADIFLSTFGTTDVSGETVEINMADIQVNGIDTGGAASVERILVDSGVIDIRNGLLEIAGFGFGFSFTYDQNDPRFALAVSMSFPADKLPWPDVSGSIGLEKSGSNTQVSDFSLAVEGGTIPGTDLGLESLTIDYLRTGNPYNGGPSFEGSGEFSIPNYFTVGLWSQFFDRCLNAFQVDVTGMNLALGNSGVFFQDIGFGASGFCGLFNYPCTEITYETKWDSDVDSDGNVNTSSGSSTTQSTLDALLAEDSSGGTILPVNVSFRADPQGGVGKVPTATPRPSFTPRPSPTPPTGIIIEPRSSGGEDEYYRTCEVEVEVPGCEVVLTFNISIGLSAGPEVNGVALAKLFAEGQFDTTGWMLIRGELLILNFNVAGAEFELNPSGPDCGARVAMYVNLLDLLKGNAEVRIDCAKNVSGDLEASLGIPESVPIIGGKTLGSVEAGFSSRKIYGSATIKIIKKISFGFEFSDGRVSFSTKKQYNRNYSPLSAHLFDRGYQVAAPEESGAARFMTNWDSLPVRTPSNSGEGIYKPYAVSGTTRIDVDHAYDSVIFVAQSFTDIPDAVLSSPSGLSYSTDTVSDPNVIGIDLTLDSDYLTAADANKAFVDVREATTIDGVDYPNRVDFLLVDPPVGTYSLRLNNAAALNEVSIEALTPNAEPSIRLTKSGYITASPTPEVEIEFEAFDIDDDAEIEFFLDSDYEGGDGILVANAVETDGSGRVTFDPSNLPSNSESDPLVRSATDWNGDQVIDELDEDLAAESGIFLQSFTRTESVSVPSGRYYVVAKITDDVNGAVYVYGDPIQITNPDAPTQPSNVKVTPASGTILVTWEGSTDPNNDLVGYKVLYSSKLNGISFGNSIGVDIRNDNDVDVVGGRYFKRMDPNVSNSWIELASGHPAFPINTTSKLHSVTIPNLVSGCPYRVAVVAYDSMRNDSEMSDVVYSAPINGSGENQPHITSEPVKVARLGTAYEYHVTTRDIDGGKISYVLDHGPHGMTVDDFGRISFIPAPEQVGSVTVAVSAIDDTGLFDTQEYLLRISSPLEGYPDPVFCSRPDYTAYVGQAYQYQVDFCQPGRFTDNDKDNPSIIASKYLFRLVDAPRGMTISTSGRISWFPIVADIGSHRVVIEMVETGSGASTPPLRAVQSYHLIVQDTGDVMQDGGPVDLSEFSYPTATPTPLRIVPITFTPIRFGTLTPTPTPTATNRRRIPTGIFTYRPLRTSTPTPTPTSRFVLFFDPELISEIVKNASNLLDISGARNLRVSSNNRFVFAAGADANTFSMFRFDEESGSLTLTGSVSGITGADRFDLSPDGRNAFVASSDGRLHVLQADDSGFLDLVTSEEVAEGAIIREVVSHSNNRFVFVSDSNGRVFTYQWDNAARTLTRLSVMNNVSSLQSIANSLRQISGGTYGVTMLVSDDGNFLYHLDPVQSVLTTYRINTTNGRLTFLQKVESGVKPAEGLALSPNGRFLQIQSGESGTVLVMARDASSGRLTLLSRSDDTSLRESRRMVFDPDGEVFYSITTQGIGVFETVDGLRPQLIHTISVTSLAGSPVTAVGLTISGDGNVLFVTADDNQTGETRLIVVQLGKTRQAPTPRPTPTPTRRQVSAGQVFILDSINSDDDLSGSSDIDSPDDRELALRWKFDVGDAVDHHVYVQVDGGERTYLGRTGDANATTFRWKAGERFIAAMFRNGPEDGHSYRFIVFVLRSGAQRVSAPYTTEGAVGFKVDTGMQVTPTPGIAENAVIVTDNPDSKTDLSNSKDVDAPNDRELTVQWKLSYTDAIDYHVYVQVDGSRERLYLGRAGDGTSSYFRWRQNGRFVVPLFRDGPQDGAKYLFSVFALRSGETRVSGPFSTLGAVEFIIESIAQPSPTKVETALPTSTMRPAGTATPRPVPTNAATKVASPLPTVTPRPEPTKQPTSSTGQQNPLIGMVTVSDDVNRFDDLSFGKDFDSGDQRELVIRWYLEKPEQWLLDKIPVIEGTISKITEIIGLLASDSTNNHEQIKNGLDSFVAEAETVQPTGEIRVDEATSKLDYPLIQTGFDVIQSFRIARDRYNDPLAGEERNNITTHSLEHSRNLLNAQKRLLQSVERFPEESGLNSSDIKEFHIYVNMDGEAPVFLSRVETGNRFVWNSQSQLLNPVLSSGPQFGNKYVFSVFVLTKSGEPFAVGPFGTAGEVEFLEETVPVGK